jgi:DNA-binding response OmpR family regulator
MPRKKTVLIVESDPVINQALTEALAREMHDVLDARDGSEGLALALKFLPDFVFIDTANLQHDGVDGFSLVYKIRHNDWGRNVPLLILGAEASDETRLREGFEDAPLEFIDASEAPEVGAIAKQLCECLTELLPGSL